MPKTISCIICWISIIMSALYHRKQKGYNNKSNMLLDNFLHFFKRRKCRLGHFNNKWLKHKRYIRTNHHHQQQTPILDYLQIESPWSCITRIGNRKVLVAQFNYTQIRPGSQNCSYEYYGNLSSNWAMHFLQLY